MSIPKLDKIFSITKTAKATINPLASNKNPVNELLKPNGLPLLSSQTWGGGSYFSIGEIWNTYLIFIQTGHIF